MNIPFTKAHGAHNDFLLTWRDQLPSSFDAPSAAVAICDRHTGAGAGPALAHPGPGGDRESGARAKLAPLRPHEDHRSAPGRAAVT